MTEKKADRNFKRHQIFDLMLPSNELLEGSVGACVKRREVCHEWPLSCVERVVFDGDVEKYCKNMRIPSMEVEVYSTLTSPILVPHLVLLSDGTYSSLVLDAFSGQPLSRDFFKNVGFSEFVDNLRRQLVTISGVRPVFVDFSTNEEVKHNLIVMVDRLHRRFGPGSSVEIDRSLLLVAEQYAASTLIHETFIQDAVYSNGDLSKDNILVSGQELRVIDWQFPRIASLNVELVNLYTSLGLDPLIRLSKAEVAAGLLCKIRWLAECADKWLTTCSYKSEIAGLLAQLKQLGVVTS